MLILALYFGFAKCFAWLDSFARLAAKMMVPNMPRMG